MNSVRRGYAMHEIFLIQFTSLPEVPLGIRSSDGAALHGTRNIVFADNNARSAAKMAASALLLVDPRRAGEFLKYLANFPCLGIETYADA